jgi:predicted GIY-YIG superfamily endonuclease
MPNYTFYKIYSKHQTNTELYIGSTKDFEVRKKKHIWDCNTVFSPNYNSKLYTYIRSNGGITEFDFEIIDIIIFSGNSDRFLHEKKLIQLYGSTLNTHYSLYIKEKNEKKLLEKQDKLLYIKEKNEKKLLEKQDKLNTYITCSCGITYRLCNRYNHLTSNEHKIRLDAIIWFIKKHNLNFDISVYENHINT